jgi:hypothetical protein
MEQILQKIAFLPELFESSNLLIFTELFSRFSWKFEGLLPQVATCPGGRCYDSNFKRFSPISGEKIGVFIKNQCHDQNFAKLAAF